MKIILKNRKLDREHLFFCLQFFPAEASASYGSVEKGRCVGPKRAKVHLFLTRPSTHQISEVYDIKTALWVQAKGGQKKSMINWSCCRFEPNIKNINITLDIRDIIPIYHHKIFMAFAEIIRRKHWMWLKRNCTNMECGSFRWRV